MLSTLTTIDAAEFRDAMSRHAAAVHLVTTDGPAGRRGVTVSSACSVSDDPATLLVCLNVSSPANDRFEQNGNFAVNLLSERNEAIARAFAGQGGLSPEERFAKGEWTTLQTGAPILKHGAGRLRLPARRGARRGDAPHPDRRGAGGAHRAARAGTPLPRPLLPQPLGRRRAMGGGRRGSLPSRLRTQAGSHSSGNCSRTCRARQFGRPPWRTHCPNRSTRPSACSTAENYVADRSLATVLFLALKMGRPLFLEGEAGVGKTEIAKVLAAALDRPLIRLQCYEGLDVSSALYEWNYAAQMIEIRLREATGDTARDAMRSEIFSERFLIRRPILQALEGEPGRAPVLLIDELDRTDEAFEAFLLEILSDNQVTIPELGTIRAAEPPIVVITTNRTREIHDALKRRCLYHWVDYPASDRELQIVRRKAPRANADLAEELVAFVQRLRQIDLFKAPGVAETIDWANALTELNAVALDPAHVSDTLGVLLKYQDDIQRMERGESREILNEVKRDLMRALLTPWAARRTRRATRSRRPIRKAGSPTTSPISPGRCARPG